MYLGIDCGTQGTKALLVDERGAVLGRGYAGHRLIERPNGAREQDPQWWVDALIAATRGAASEISGGMANVRALAISGQQHGLVILDEALRVIRAAKLWNDTETAPQNARLIDLLGGRESWLERFGIVPLTGYTVSKLLWVKENEPANFARIRHILLPHEYLNWWLTGEFCAEPGDASGTGYFDNRTRRWTGEVLDAIDGGTGQLVAALPRLIASDEIVGRLRPEAAEKLGLPGDCVVAAGGGDNMLGAIGTGNVEEGVVTLSLGTSSTVYSYSAGPVAHAGADVAPFCSSSGGWLPLVCTMNATNVVTATIQLVGKTLADIEPALEATQPGADGLVFLPFLNGERTPDLPTARGTLTGVSSTNFTAHHLIRAAVEGVSFGILSGLDRILDGRHASVLQVIGGGARSRGWRQLLADATGTPVQVPAEEEAGCLGAAIQARVAYYASRGEALSFSRASAEFIRMEPGATAQPRPELEALYSAARQAYRAELLRLYAV